MGLESQSTTNSCHKPRPIKADQPSIVWIKFITPSSSFGPSLECPALESAQISWISPLSASLIFLDLALVIGLTGICNGSLNALWFSSLTVYKTQHLLQELEQTRSPITLFFTLVKFSLVQLVSPFTTLKIILIYI